MHVVYSGEKDCDEFGVFPKEVGECVLMEKFSITLCDFIEYHSVWYVCGLPYRVLLEVKIRGH